jgi:hypothetical protein
LDTGANLEKILRRSRISPIDLCCARFNVMILILGVRRVEVRMKLEYLPAGSSDCPLIRLYDFTREEVRQFHVAVSALATGAADRVEVHRLPFVEPVAECRLVLVRSGWDQAVIRRAIEFECGFTAGTWDNVAGLVEPFAQSARGFQWLAGVPGEAALLLSASGQW